LRDIDLVEESQHLKEAGFPLVGVLDAFAQRNRPTSVHDRIHVATPDSPFEIQRGDVVFPICGAGENRSQVLYQLLTRHVRSDFTVRQPHGAECKLDAYMPAYMCALPARSAVSSIPDDEFASEFGGHRVPLLGEQEFSEAFGDFHDSDSPLFARTCTFFDRNLFGLPVTIATAPEPRPARIVYMCFGRSAHVVLKRINEALERLAPAGSASVPLHPFVVVVLPFSDEIAHPSPGLRPFSAAAYQAASAAFLSVLRLGRTDAI
jgi:hypothetical protein